MKATATLLAITAWPTSALMSNLPTSRPARTAIPALFAVSSDNNNNNEDPNAGKDEWAEKWAAKWSSSSSSKRKKPGLPIINDDNYLDILHNSSYPAVLVDAFAPWCGPCKLLDKVLQKAQPKYLASSSSDNVGATHDATTLVKFVRWNVNDHQRARQIQTYLQARQVNLTKLPSLLLFQNGRLIAVRPGFANHFQLDAFLEHHLPHLLQPTFDQDGVKLLPLPTPPTTTQTNSPNYPNSPNNPNDINDTLQNTFPIPDTEQDILDNIPQVPLENCHDEQECWETVEQSIWQNRTVVPATEGILLPNDYTPIIAP